jgi:hypothetical protein
MGHERPIRLGDWHVRSYLDCGCARTRVRHSGFGPQADVRRWSWRGGINDSGAMSDWANNVDENRKIIPNWTPFLPGKI